MGLPIAVIRIQSSAAHAIAAISGTRRMARRVDAPGTLSRNALPVAVSASRPVNVAARTKRGSRTRSARSGRTPSTIVTIAAAIAAFSVQAHQRASGVDGVDINISEGHLRRAGRGGEVWQRLDADLTLRHAAFASQRVDQTIARDRVEPRDEWPPWIVGVPSGVHGYQRLLHHILCPGHDRSQLELHVSPRRVREQDEQLDVRVFIAFLGALHKPGGLAFLLGSHWGRTAPWITTQPPMAWLHAISPVTDAGNRPKAYENNWWPSRRRKEASS